MKKTILLTSLLLVLAACHSGNKKTETTQVETAQASATQETEDITSHTVENSLDWFGSYEGTIPCASCDGIKITLTLNENKTYSLVEKYEGKNIDDIITKGSFKFNDDNPSLITLDESGQNRIFFIGENFLEVREIGTGNKIDSAHNYTLKKLPN